MSNLVPTQDTSAIHLELIDGQPTTTSLDVALHFGKRHDAVLRAIRNLDCSAEFAAHNFVASDYTDSSGRRLTQYRMTRDGFTFLCMGFTGTSAARWKEAYISAFNALEQQHRHPVPFRFERLLTTVENGRVTAIVKVPDEACVATRDNLAEVVKNLAPEMVLLKRRHLRDIGSEIAGLGCEPGQEPLRWSI